MRHKYTKESIKEAVAVSITWADTCRLLGIKPASGSQSHLKKRATEFGIDFSHFKGKSWNLGKKLGPKREVHSYLVKNSTTKSSEIRERLIHSGLKAACCENCGVSEWMGEPVVLELDHINREHTDNRLENLMILCPNCHAAKTRKDRALIAQLGRGNELRPHAVSVQI